VDEIELQSCLAPVWISKRLELRLARSESKWSLQANMIDSGEKEVRHQKRSSAWCGVREGQGECWWSWRSAEWNWRAQIQAKECCQGLKNAYPAEQPIHAEKRRKGSKVASLEWNRCSLKRDQGGGLMSTHSREEEQTEEAVCSAQRNIEAPIQTEERQQGLRSANGNWGAPTRIE